MLELLFLLPTVVIFLGIFTYDNMVRMDLEKSVEREKNKNK